MSENELRSLTPAFPLYPEAQQFLRVIEGVAYPIYGNMANAIREQTGNPQAIVDWSNPDVWIVERLQGTARELALKIWQESQHEVNPRYTRGSWYLAQRHNLLSRDNQNILHVTERGRKFLDNQKSILAEIDDYEGVLTALRLVAERGSGSSGDFHEEFLTYCRTFTGYQGRQVIKRALGLRLVNLVNRNYLSKKGINYEITDAGLTYLDNYSKGETGRTYTNTQSELLRLAKTVSEESRNNLAEYLSSMNPYKFERVISLLLEAMGYINVETTSPVNDKGIDVVADIELGISRVREVVQVKRHSANIQRPVLDALRGSLHRFKAVRGTIITIGGFSKGTKEAAFELGAAPITLIDGERLLDLLIQYSIGVKKKPIEYMEFDESGFSQVDEDVPEDE